MIEENKYLNDECFAIVGAAMEVHRTFGKGFTEYVYQDALEIEFKQRGIPYEREKRINVFYKGVELRHSYVADFVCYDEIIVELKAVAELNQAHGSQVINYLHATNMPLGLILNFGEDSLVRERYANFKIIPPAIVEKANQILNKKKG